MKRRTPAQIALDKDYYQWAAERLDTKARMTAALATYIRFEVEGFEGWRRARARRPRQSS